MGEVASAHFQTTPESARAAIARADESLECRAFATIIKFGSRFGLAKNAIALLSPTSRFCPNILSRWTLSQLAETLAAK
jgi:hypothetical protein